MSCCIVSFLVSVQQMSSAVIAVPNRVSAEEREIITKAAGKCGVKSVRFLHSGIAVVLAHGLDVPVKGTEAPPRKIREKVLVYRLGGFNADVSVIRYIDVCVGRFEAMSSPLCDVLQCCGRSDDSVVIGIRSDHRRLAIR